MGSDNTLHGRRSAAAIILVGTVALAACAGADDSDSAALDGGSVATTPAEALGDGIGPEAAGDDVGDPAGAPPPGFDIGVVGRDVIIEMHVVVGSDDIERTVSSIMAGASALGGGVASSDVSYGDRGHGDRADGASDGYAVLVVKVPPTEIDRMLDRVGASGVIESIDQSAADVTEQLVDLDVRITNARRSVENVRGFMDRAVDLDDLVTLEGELTRRQTELERLEAQQRNLAERVALSTITVEVVPTAQVPRAEPDEGIGDALRTGWDAFAGFVFVLGFVLAVALPFLALGLVLAGLAWLVVRSGRSSAPQMVDRRTADDASRANAAVSAAESVSATREE
jgi:hypothetical protein